MNMRNGDRRTRALVTATVGAVLLAGLLVTGPATAQAGGADDAESTTITVYSRLQPGAVPPELYRPSTNGQQRYGQMTVPGYGIVKQERLLTIPMGRSALRFTDVASQIDPTTVRFTSLTDPAGTRVLEQNYQFDLVSVDKLMERFLGQHVTLEQKLGDGLMQVEGTLLSADGAYVIQDERGGVQVIQPPANVQLPQLPEGLITKPTLVWDVFSKTGGEQRTRVSYETGGLTWWADYNLTFADGEDANSGWLDVGAWVSLLNQSGATYPDATLKLVAGEVHRAPQPTRVSGMRRGKVAMAMEMEDGGGFEEKEFFEYHLYTLGRPTTLPDNSTKQLELFPVVQRVPCEKVLVYYGLGQRFGSYYGAPLQDRNYGTECNKDVDIYLRFKNDEQVGLGVPLPAGRIRVSKLDPADGSLEFIGEDTIDHTPRKEEVLVKMGTAFDVVGERKQVDFSVDTRRNMMEEEIEITLRNRKHDPVRVIVKENLYRWAEWRIVEHSQDFEKTDARTVHFPVQLKADGETTVRYRVRYTW